MKPLLTSLTDLISARTTQSMETMQDGTRQAVYVTACYIGEERIYREDWTYSPSEAQLQHDKYVAEIRPLVEKITAEYLETLAKIA